MLIGGREIERECVYVRIYMDMCKYVYVCTYVDMSIGLCISMCECVCTCALLIIAGPS